MLKINHPFLDLPSFINNLLMLSFTLVKPVMNFVQCIVQWIRIIDVTFSISVHTIVTLEVLIRLVELEFTIVVIQ